MFKPVSRQRPSRQPIAHVHVDTASRRLSAETQLRFSELYHAAVIERIGQNFDAAFELFNEAARINPHSAETYYELAQLYQDVAGQDSARLFHMADSLLQLSVQMAPYNKYYKLALVTSYTQQGRYAESIPLAREIALSDPTAENYLQLENLCELAEDYEGALFALSHLERIEGKSLENSLYQFRAYQQLGKETEGFRVMEDLCRAYPTELRYRVKMGDLYYSGGHEEMALATYNDVLTVDPDNDAAQYAMLDYYLQKGDTAHFNALMPRYLLNSRAPDYDKEVLFAGFVFDNGLESPLVIRLFDQILFVAEPNPRLVRFCAEYLGEGTEALPAMRNYYQRILEVAPSYDRVRLQALQLAINDNDDDAILRLCREGHTFNPTSAVYYFIEGNTLIQQEKIDEALEVLDNGTEYASDQSDPYIISLLYATRGQLLVEMDETEEGYAAFDSALVYNPHNNQLLYEYATLLALHGERLEQAETMINQALRSDGKNPLYLATYAYTLGSLGRVEQAREVIDSSILLVKEQADWGYNDEYGRIFDHAGDIYAGLGLTDEAVNFWKQSLEITTDPELQQIIQKKVRQRRI